MTNEKFDEARMIKERIQHISIIIDLISTFDYKCEPPIRYTGLSISRNSNKEVVLNEGEVVFLRRSLETERERLRDEFEKL